MTDAARTLDWAGVRRRRWSAARLAAAAALNVLVLLSLKLAVDRVALPRHGPERVTSLVTVALHVAPPPVHALPAPHPQPPAPAVAHAPTPTPTHAPAPARTPEASKKPAHKP